MPPKGPEGTPQEGKGNEKKGFFESLKGLLSNPDNTPEKQAELVAARQANQQRVAERGRAVTQQDREAAIEQASGEVPIVRSDKRYETGQMPSVKVPETPETPESPQQ